MYISCSSFASRVQCSLMPAGMYLQFIFLYSSFYKGVANFVSKFQLINLAPSFAPDITMFSSNFFSISDAASAQVSLSYSSLSPPVTNHIMFGSDLRGLQSHTTCAYLTFHFIGTSSLVIKYTVYVDFTLYMTPLANLPNSLLMLRIRICESAPKNKSLQFLIFHCYHTHVLYVGYYISDVLINFVLLCFYNILVSSCTQFFCMVLILLSIVQVW